LVLVGLADLCTIVPRRRVRRLSKEHVRAQKAKHHDAGERDHQVSFPQAAQDLDDLDTPGCSCQTTGQQYGADLEVHISQAEMSRHPGRGGGDHLARTRRCCHSGGNANHHESWGEEKTSPTPTSPESKPTEVPMPIK
jgi:hypothetical protein